MTDHRATRHDHARTACRTRRPGRPTGHRQVCSESEQIDPLPLDDASLTGPHPPGGAGFFRRSPGLTDHPSQLNGDAAHTVGGQIDPRYGEDAVFPEAASSGDDDRRSLAVEIGQARQCRAVRTLRCGQRYVTDRQKTGLPKVHLGYISPSLTLSLLGFVRIGQIETVLPGIEQCCAGPRAYDRKRTARQSDRPQAVMALDRSLCRTSRALLDAYLARPES
jgi:hypothetical protein